MVTTRELAADYLVIGAGAMGMAFTDEILTRNSADRVVLVDRHARPGGHWNDAYSFVSLHQPAAYYGVNSEKLGSGGAALASGTEVLAYFERVLAKWVRTGRLTHYPLCESTGGARFASCMAPDREYVVSVRKRIVDATYMKVEVPSMRPPPFPVADGLCVVPPNGLAEIEAPHARYVIVGAGKTGIDAALFLLDRDVDPDRIAWIMPNDAWFLDRDQIQPGCALKDGVGVQLENFAEAQTVDEVFRSLEASDRVLRLDAEVWPTKYRCATVTRDELARLRRIRDVVRRGRVVRIDSDAIVLEERRLPTDEATLHIDCTANGLSARPVVPVFDGDRITLQSLFMCQQVFSAALIGYVESLALGDAAKNELCQVVPHPEVPRDYVAAMSVSFANGERWRRQLGGWLRRSRLFLGSHESTFSLLQAAWHARRAAPRALPNMQRILEREFPDGAVPVGP